MCKGLAVSHQAIPAYNPRSNAQVERRFGTLKRLMRSCCRGLQQEDWSYWLQPITHAVNISTNSSTGVTPYALLHGREAQTPISNILGIPEPEEVTVTEYLTILSNNFVKLYLQADEGVKTYQRRTAATYNQKSPIDDKNTLE